MDRRSLRAVVLMAMAVGVIAAASATYLGSAGPGASPVSVARSAPPMVTVEPVDYYFSTATEGWAVRNPTSAADFGVFRTTDAAMHWREVLELDPGLTQFVEPAVQFLDSSHAFVAIGAHFQRLTRTSDGGAHWQSLALPYGSVRVDAVAFSDPDYGWLLVGGGSTRLFETRNSGATWRRLPDPPGDAETLSFRGPHEAWLGAAAVGTPHVYISTDGGTSWTRRDLPPPPRRTWDGGLPSRVELLPGGGVQVLLPPVGQPDFLERGYALILTARDEGAGWRYVPTPPGVLAYEDSSHWWAMFQTSLFKSSDGGQTWATVTNRLPDWRFVPHVIDGQHAWAAIQLVTGNGLALTDDGGFHWSRASVPVASY